MPLPQLQSEYSYTYADYITWDEGRWELINGEVWDMTPAPSRMHQEISIKLSSLLHEFFKERDCSVYAAPFDVRLSGDDIEDYTITNVVQPDISIICDREKLDDRGCIGAPDLIVEILSPSTAAKDLKIKRDLYEKHGVNEYWLVHPTDRIVMVYLLDESEQQYGKARILDKQDVLQSAVFKELEVMLTNIFQDI